MATDNQTQAIEKKMDSETLLSVVVPVRNRPKLIVRALDSIVGQTCRKFRLIIVDNASTDNTLEVIREWVKRNEYRLPSVEILEESRPGAPAARNRGLAAVETDYVAFFDSDDVMRPRHISRIVDAIKRNPEADLFRWPVMIIDEEGWSSLKDPQSGSASELQLHLLHSTLSTQRWAARTSIVRECGGWNENLESFQDYELGVRLLKKCGDNVIVVRGEPTVAIYPQPDSISRRSLSERFQTVSNVYDIVDPIIADDAGAVEIMRFRRIITSAILSRQRSAMLSRKMREQAMEGASRATKIRLQIVRLFHQTVGKGGSSLAMMIYR